VHDVSRSGVDHDVVDEEAGAALHHDEQLVIRMDVKRRPVALDVIAAGEHGVFGRERRPLHGTDPRSTREGANRRAFVASRPSGTIAVGSKSCRMSGPLLW